MRNELRALKLKSLNNVQLVSVKVIAVADISLDRKICLRAVFLHEIIRKIHRDIIPMSDTHKCRDRSRRGLDWPRYRLHCRMEYRSPDLEAIACLSRPDKAADKNARDLHKFVTRSDVHWRKCSIGRVAQVASEAGPLSVSRCVCSRVAAIEAIHVDILNIRPIGVVIQEEFFAH